MVLETDTAITVDASVFKNKDAFYRFILSPGDENVRLCDGDILTRGEYAAYACAYIIGSRHELGRQKERPPENLGCVEGIFGEMQILKHDHTRTTYKSHIPTANHWAFMFGTKNLPSVREGSDFVSFGKLLSALNVNKELITVQGKHVCVNRSLANNFGNNVVSFYADFEAKCLLRLQSIHSVVNISFWENGLKHVKPRVKSVIRIRRSEAKTSAALRKALSKDLPEHAKAISEWFRDEICGAAYVPHMARKDFSTWRYLVISPKEKGIHCDPIAIDVSDPRHQGTIGKKRKKEVMRRFGYRIANIDGTRQDILEVEIGIVSLCSRIFEGSKEWHGDWLSNRIDSLIKRDTVGALRQLIDFHHLIPEDILNSYKFPIHDARWLMPLMRGDHKCLNNLPFEEHIKKLQELGVPDDVLRREMRGAFAAVCEYQDNLADCRDLKKLLRDLWRDWL